LAQLFITAPGETLEALLRAADQALYRAKAEGRDRVVVSGLTVDVIPSCELCLSPDPIGLMGV
jgi:hypothetical protein